MVCMADHLHLSLIAFCLLAGVYTSKGQNNAPFGESYYPTWGHVNILDQGKQAQLVIDPQSGGGFASKLTYVTGRIGIRLMLPKYSKGLIGTFYLTSTKFGNPDGKHDELDFEFVGSDSLPQPYRLSTNVFAQDSGGREQQFRLWFDPTEGVHEYVFLWNAKQIVFFVDGMPIRVFKNNQNIGVRYPILPMYVAASLWNNTQWIGPVDWNKGPFASSYYGFGISGCPYDQTNITKCYSDEYEWNKQGNWELTPEQRKTLESNRQKYMIYDYCQSSFAPNFPECKA